MIELTGSEKQIAWATDIREKFIANAAKEANYWEEEIAGCIDDNDTDGAEWATSKLENHNRLTSEILNDVSRAGWWIEYGRGDADYVIRNFDRAKRGVNAVAGMARFN